MRVSRTKRINKPLRAFLFSLLCLALVSGLSLGITLTWQGVESGRISIPFIAADTGENPDNNDNLTHTGDSIPAFAPQAPSLSSVNLPAPEHRRPEFPHAVPQTVLRAESSYFRSAIFFGDSLTAGIPFYIPLDGTVVVAHTGLAPANAAALLETAEKYGERENVYLMFGQDSIEDYGVLIDAVKAQYPEARIFVSS
ncbi:MAG: hypothetical protein FWH00_02240, partial [Oscillospiraceae bacterium]|nr:hypothetical protein [Oscillospiraceae bacterium]